MDWKNFKMAIVEMIPVIALFFAPAYWIMLLVLLLMGADTYNGIKASRYELRKLKEERERAKKIEELSKLDSDIKKKEWSTNRFSDFFAKLIGYGFFITVGLVIQKEANVHYAVWLSALIPIYTEVRSIDENEKRRGKKGIVKQAEELYKFALRIKKKRDDLR